MQQKKFPLGQSSSYIMRKVWYHQIVIQNNLGFMVLILIYIPWSWPKFGSHNIKLFQWLNVHWDHNISWHTYVHIFGNFVQSDIKWIWMWLHTAWPDPRTTDTQWRHKSKISESLGRCGRQNMLRLYLKIWDWDLIFGRAVKAISSLTGCLKSVV